MILDDYEMSSIRAIGDILCDETTRDKIRMAKIDAVRQLHAFVRFFLKNQFREDLIRAVWQKKLAYIMDAQTKDELQSIMRPSVPMYIGTGKLVPASRYHIEEEELLIWATMTPNHNVIHEAQERYKELFRKFYPEQAEDMGI